MKKEELNCPFCKPHLNGEKTIIESSDVLSLYDKFPATIGHSLIIPKRHCTSYFDLTTKEQTSCWNMVNKLKNLLTEKYQPDGFTIRININEAGGQKIPHVHIHLIPRYSDTDKIKSVTQNKQLQEKK